MIGYGQQYSFSNFFSTVYITMFERKFGWKDDLFSPIVKIQCSTLEHCKYGKRAFSKSPCLPTGWGGGTVPCLRQIWLSFVYWVKTTVPVSSKLSFPSTLITTPLCCLLSLWGWIGAGFCVVTVLNTEHKRKKDTQAKASFWHSNCELPLGWYNLQT